MVRRREVRILITFIIVIVSTSNCTSREAISSSPFVTLAPEPYLRIPYHHHSLTCPCISSPYRTGSTRNTVFMDTAQCTRWGQARARGKVAQSEVANERCLGAFKIPHTCSLFGIEMMSLTLAYLLGGRVGDLVGPIHSTTTSQRACRG